MGFRDGGDLYYVFKGEKRLVTENWISVTEQRIEVVIFSCKAVRHIYFLRPLDSKINDLSS